MMAQNELERERYEPRLKMQRDMYTALAEARDEGLREGVLKGQIERIHCLQRLLRRLATPQEQLQTRSLAELERLAEQLEAEVFGSLSKQ
jgi:hypothetical protein